MKNTFKIEDIPIKRIQKNPANPRVIKDHQFRSLCKSLEESPELFEARPILAVPENGHLMVLAGNMRLAAAKKLKMASVPVIVMRGLTEAQKRAIAIKDNGTWGEWNFDALADSWGDLPLLEWGVSLPADWLGGGSAETNGDAEPQIDRAEELNKVWQVKPGDLFQIGEHRLLCADSTKPKDVARLMGRDNPNLMVADPPYGVRLDMSWRDKALHKGNANKNIIANDDRADWADTWQLFKGNIAYVWHASAFSDVVMASLRLSGFEICQQLIWHKSMMVMGRSDYHWKHESCWYAVRKGKNHGWIGGRKQTTVIEAKGPNQIFGKPSDEEKTVHPTQKPIDCFMMIRNHDSKSVYDPFLGSGTTMVACQNLKRKCLGIEISPEYCAVTLQRMADAFGIKGVRVNG
jgi:DNA modification methylase